MNENQYDPNEEKLLGEWSDDDSVGLDVKQARKLVWGTRFVIIRSVVLTIAVLLLLYWGFTAGMHSYYSKTAINDFDRYVATTVEVQNPGIFVEKPPFPSHTTIDSSMTLHTALKLFQPVGKSNVVIGEVTAEKKPFSPATVHLNMNQIYLNQDNVDWFALPNDSTKADGSKELVWNQIQHIGDGFVGVMSFSTKTGMDPAALQQELTKYDLYILGMPVLVGHYSFKSSSNGIVKVPTELNLRPYVSYDQRGMATSYSIALNDTEYPKQSKPDLDKSQSQLVPDLSWLIANRYSNNGQYYQQNISYIQQHGIVVYGAVVTGPIRELEKLKQEANLYQFHLERVEVWNW